MTSRTHTPEDIKTIDFERIFREANDYFIAAQKVLQKKRMKSP